MEIRTATHHDLEAIRRLDAATMAEVDDDWAHRTPTAAALKRAVLAGSLLVVADPSGTVIAYAIAEHHADRVEMSPPAFAATPDGTEAAAGVVAAVRDRFPHLPVCTNVVLGDPRREGSLEAVGFVPGEVLADVHAGELVVTRRWWAPARDADRRNASRFA